MRITRVNAEPYSDELHDRILLEKGAELKEKAAYAVYNPYAFGSTGDLVTILFEGSDKKQRIVLPFQTNETSVFNDTVYTGKPRWNWLKGIVFGQYASVDPQRLREFFDRLNQVHLSELRLDQRRERIQNADWNARFSGKTLLGHDSYTINPEIPAPEEAEHILEHFCAYPQRFRIDPESDVRVERRARDGVELYTASLNIRVYTGLSGVPGISEHIGQTITAKVGYH